MTKKVKKISLSFINKGKPFVLNNWTTKKHEEVLRETAKFQKGMDEKELDRKYRNLLILKGLIEIDPSVTEEDILSVCPDGILELFSAVYLQGKRSIFVDEDGNFRAKDSKKKTTAK